MRVGDGECGQPKCFGADIIVAAQMLRMQLYQELSVASSEHMHTGLEFKNWPMRLIWTYTPDTRAVSCSPT